ncbi:MAG TPA: hypothetical protein VIE64_09090 [Solirubrobacterales bacterium]|jgi:hypothetical protein
MTNRPHYEPCEECGAALDPQQRYCVHCAARRGNGANPASRYFAAMSKRARRPLTRPPAKSSPGSRAAAVGFFALLPIAVAIGVVVGKAGSGEDSGALLQALREQDAAIASSETSSTSPVASKGKLLKGGKQAHDKSGGKVVAQTENGTVHQITDFKPTEQKVEEDTKLVETNVEQAGADYIKAQQNLPDVIVVGGDPDSAPSQPTGKGQP